MSNPTTTNGDLSSTFLLSGKFLTFQLAEEFYGIDVMVIREIIRIQRITPVPQMPDHVKGVINLRGKVIPIVDLRLKFGLQPEETNTRTCVIVVDINNSERGSTLLGLVVDSVEEVLDISENEVDQSPNFSMAQSAEYCLGITKNEQSMMTLLDIEKVVYQEMSGELATM